MVYLYSDAVVNKVGAGYTIQESMELWGLLDREDADTGEAVSITNEIYEAVSCSIEQLPRFVNGDERVQTVVKYRMKIGK